MQFDVYENTDKDTKKVYPYFVEIQNNLLDTLNSRVVIPLVPIKNVSKDYPKHLCPIITINNKDVALLAHQITSVTINLLKRKAISAETYRTEIIAAIDFLAAGI